MKSQNYFSEIWFRLSMIESNSIRYKRNRQIQWRATHQSSARVAWLLLKRSYDWIRSEKVYFSLAGDTQGKEISLPSQFSIYVECDLLIRQWIWPCARHHVFYSHSHSIIGPPALSNYCLRSAISINLRQFVAEIEKIFWDYLLCHVLQHLIIVNKLSLMKRNTNYILKIVK